MLRFGLESWEWLQGGNRLGRRQAWSQGEHHTGEYGGPGKALGAERSGQIRANVEEKSGLGCVLDWMQG